MNSAALLLVTWIISGQTPASYEAQYSSIAACEDARAKVTAEQQRLLGAEADYIAQIKAKGVIQLPRNIMVTAICTAK